MTAGSQTGITRAIATMTVRQVLGVRRFIMLGLLALAPAVVLFFAAARTNDAGRTDAFVGIVSGMYFALVVPITALVLASSSLGEERREETLSFLVLRPVSRSRIAVAKMLGAFAAAVGGGRSRRRRRQPGDGVPRRWLRVAGSPSWSAGWWGRLPTWACSSRSATPSRRRR